jgi:alanine racemase
LRPGIGLYGGHPGPFATVARLTAPILQVRTIAAGETVGYGATYRAPGVRRIATVAAGYADGLLRALSGRGYGVAEGRRCPFAGRVSMDLITLDVTDVGEAARVGAEVELIGPRAKLAEIAAAADSVPYELLTSLRSAPRRYVGAAA